MGDARLVSRIAVNGKTKSQAYRKAKYIALIHQKLALRAEQDKSEDTPYSKLLKGLLKCSSSFYSSNILTPYALTEALDNPTVTLTIDMTKFPKKRVKEILEQPSYTGYIQELSKLDDTKVSQYVQYLKTADPYKKSDFLAILKLSDTSYIFEHTAYNQLANRDTNMKLTKKEQEIYTKLCTNYEKYLKQVAV